MSIDADSITTEPYGARHLPQSVRPLQPRGVSPGFNSSLDVGLFGAVRRIAGSVLGPAVSRRPPPE